MRCLVVADLHYSLPQFDWLLSAAPKFDLVIFAGDALDVGSHVDFRAQIVVVKKYLELLTGITKVILCSGNHDLDERSAEGEKISGWIGDVRALGIACDGDSLVIGDTLFTVCPWWDGPLVKQRLEDQLREAATGGCGAGSGCITRRPQIRRQLGRQALFRRRRPGAVDQPLSACDGGLGPRASIAIHSRRLVVRPAWRHLGVQHRPAARPAAGLHRARYRRRQGVLAADWRCAIYRPQGAAAAAGLAIVQPPAWLISLDRIADPNLARPPSAAG